MQYHTHFSTPIIGYCYKNRIQFYAALLCLNKKIKTNLKGKSGDKFIGCLWLRPFWAYYIGVSHTKQVGKFLSLGRKRNLEINLILSFIGVCRGELNRFGLIILAFVVLN